MRRTLVALTSILSFAACISEPKRLPAAMDPSNPDAPEAPAAALPTAFAAFTPERPVPANAPAAAASDAGVTLYTCPMHPEVRSHHPGTCPKCGMGPEPTDAGRSGSAPLGHALGHGEHP